MKYIFLITAILLAIITTGCFESDHKIKTGYNTKASPDDSTIQQILKWKVITSFINRNDSSMATLYGNDIAVTYARTHIDSTYPAAAELALITWKQQNDEHWYGASIPATMLTAELVKFNTSVNGTALPVYEKYLPKENTLSSEKTNTGVQTRMHFIITQHASLLP